MKNTDTNFTASIRDFPSDMKIQITTGGTTAFTTPEKYIAEHDAALAAARREGAVMLLDKMTTVLYNMDANGAFDVPEFSEDYKKGVKEGAITQLEVAGSAIKAGLIDFADS